MKILKISLFIAIVSSIFLFWPKNAPHVPKVYDCFLFYNELELLEIRLNEMNEAIDKFVLVEACETFRGKPKPFYFAENRHLFEKFADKIIHVQLTRPLKTDNPWVRERHQRAQILQGLKGAHPDDIIFVSDLDEIIRGSRIPEIAQLIRSKKAGVAVCSMTMYNGYLNRFLTDGWRGPVCSTYRQMKKATPALMRRLRNLNPRKLRRAGVSKAELIPDAGWHFTSMGGVGRTILKIESFSHARLDTPEFKNEQKILQEIRSLPLRPIDSTFPRYVQENQKKFEQIGFIDTELLPQELSY